MAANLSQAIELFLCYAHEDEKFRLRLEKQLRVLKRQELIDVWHDRQIHPGDEWEDKIDKHLNSAQIILLLISPDFIDSDYCYGIEMTRAMERHQCKEARVIPIILRPTHWQGTPFGKLQALPPDAIPVVSRKWHNQDEAFFYIAEGIKKVVEDFFSPVSQRNSQSERNRQDESKNVMSSHFPYQQKEESLESIEKQAEMSTSYYLGNGNLDNPLAESGYEKEQLLSTDVVQPITISSNQIIPNPILQEQSQDEQTSEKIATRGILAIGFFCILCGFALGQFFEALGAIIFFFGSFVGGYESCVGIAAFLQKKKWQWLVILFCIAILDVILMSIEAKDFISFILGTIGSFVFFSSPVLFIESFDWYRTSDN